MEEYTDVLKSKTCLIINIYDFDRLLLEEVLESSGVDIVCTSPAGFFETPVSKKIDVAIIDLEEPAADELDALLQEILKRYKCPIIGITGYSYFPLKESKINAIVHKINIVPKLVETILQCIKR